MTEDLVRKKRVRAGHRASTTRILTQISSVLATLAASRHNQSIPIKAHPPREVGNLEIVELTPDGDLVGEIEQADSHKQDIYAALVGIEGQSLNDGTLGRGRVRWCMSYTPGEASQADTSPLQW